MKLLLTSSAVGVALALSPAYAQQPPPAPLEKEGEITVQGVQPSRVLGAIDTEKLVGAPPAETAETDVDAVEPPTAKKEVIVGARVTETPDATITTTTRVITPVSDRPELDPETPIAPEVQAVVDSKENYTTADIVMAQLEAVRNTPVVEPTTVIRTTTVVPDPG